MAQYDTNRDGAITSKDAIYNELQIWRDYNQDGKTDAGELTSLADAGIASIKVKYQSEKTSDAVGNAVYASSDFLKEDGTLAQTQDVFFTTDTFHTVATKEDTNEYSEDILALPDLKGYGALYDLHRAMAEDSSGELKRLVESYGTASSSDREGIVDAILFKWAGCEGIRTNSRGMYMDARRVAFLEAVMGRDFVQGNDSNPRHDAAQILNEEYLNIRSAVNTSLGLQFDTYHVAENIRFIWNEEDQCVNLDMSEIQKMVAENFSRDPSISTEIFQQAMQVAKELDLSEAIYEKETFLSQCALYGADIAYQVQSEGKDNVLNFVDGGSKKFIQSTANRDYVVRASNGGDLIETGNGQDVLISGKGNDSLKGGEGADTYYWTPGSGNDFINNAANDLKTDTLVIGGGVAATDLEFSRDDDYGLRIAIGEEAITIKNWFFGSGYRHLNISFGDGTVLTPDDINHRAEYLGTEGDNTLRGTDGLANNIYGLGGNDSLYGSGRSDVLAGGTGNDYLEGKKGADTYFWAKGDGNDTIYNYDTELTQDKLVMKGVDSAHVDFVRSDSDLVIASVGDGPIEYVRIKNWYAKDAYRHMDIQLDDVTLTTEDIMSHIHENPVNITSTYTGTLNGDIIVNKAGSQTYARNGGNDVLVYTNDVAWGKDTIKEADGHLSLILEGLTSEDIFVNENASKKTLTITKKADSAQSITVKGYTDGSCSIFVNPYLQNMHEYLTEYASADAATKIDLALGAKNEVASVLVGSNKALG